MKKLIVYLLSLLMLCSSVVGNLCIIHAEEEDTTGKIKFDRVFISVGGAYGVELSESTPESPAYLTSTGATLWHVYTQNGSGFDSGYDYRMEIDAYRKNNTSFYDEDTLVRHREVYIGQELIVDGGYEDYVGATMGVISRNSYAPGEYYVRVALIPCIRKTDEQGREYDEDVEGTTYYVDGKDNPELTMVVKGNYSNVLFENSVLGVSSQETLLYSNTIGDTLEIGDNIVISVPEYKDTDIRLVTYIYKSTGGTLGDIVAGPIENNLHTNAYGVIDEKVDTGSFDPSLFEEGERYSVYKEIYVGSERIGTLGGGAQNRYSFIMAGDIEIPEDEESTITFTIKKVDADTEELLPGATLKLLKGEGTSGEQIGDTWVSGENDPTFEIAPGTYTLVEEAAPDGYAKMDPYTFTLTEEDAYESLRNYGAYTVSGYPYDITIHLANNPDDPGKVGYCFNVEKHSPVDDPETLQSMNPIYKEYLGTEENLEKYVDNIAWVEDDFREKLIRALYIGYPKNATGLQEKYELSSNDAFRATQRAVWTLVDGEVYESTAFMSAKQFEYYTELIEVQSEEDEPVIPEDFTMYLYVANNQNYQNVLSWKEAPQVYELTVKNKKAELTDITVKKSWDDWNDDLGRRPEKVKVSLLCDDEVVAEEEITASEEWTRTFKNLEKGKTYTIKEDFVDYYITRVDDNNYELHNITRPWFPVTPDQDDVYGNLVIKKTVSNGAKPDKSYRFEVAMVYPNGFKFKETISLKGNEEILYDYVQEGTEITVKELDCDGYTVTVKADDKTIQNGESVIGKKNTTTYITFNNALKKDSPDTSDQAHIMMWMGILIGSIIVTGFTYMMNRRIKENE